MASDRAAYALPLAVICVAACAGQWHQIVSRDVPEPYLDEVFHVRQAQQYCEGNWHVWDPKITTPPGLYLVSWAVFQLTGQCDVSSLRSLNAGAICLVCVLAYDILRNVRRSSAKAIRQSEDWRVTLLDAHSAFNISLFPPLFFFSALYYTDVVSTLCVLQSYNVSLQSRIPTVSSTASALQALAVGTAALCFRQTNIFWVAVFPAALAAVDALHRSSEPAASTGDGEAGVRGILQDSWNHGIVYDPPLYDAGVSDGLVFLLFIGLAALGRPWVVLRAIRPYAALAAMFAAFVAYNGGVVLANHVASLHLPQMLYIWPYMQFFCFALSAPLALASVAGKLPEGRLKSLCRGWLAGVSPPRRPRLWSSALFVALGLVAVRFNTIIHPFTLADNRHYVFYAFRLLGRNPAVPYLAVVAYCACAWMTLQTLATKPLTASTRANTKYKDRETSASADTVPVRTSLAIVWLAATTLSVATAPLVEPRYFIVPWALWRLHTPSLASSHPQSRGPLYDWRLVLETTWLVAVNLFTAHVFLYRGFVWPQEPGRTQRFLW